MSATKSADAAVLEILRNSKRDDEGLTLAGQLSREEYQKVNKFLEMAGAKWNRKLAKHIYSGSAKADIERLLETGSVTDKKQLYQAFYTPDHISESMVRLANVVAGENVLEPSAGVGSIAKAIAKTKAELTCVELNPDSAAVLESSGFAVHCRDFLECKEDEICGPFDAVIMNPPFTKNQAFEHVLHAAGMLCDMGVLVAIVPNGNPRGKVLAAKWDELMGHCEYQEELEAGTFKESGTNVTTKIICLRVSK